MTPAAVALGILAATLLLAFGIAWRARGATSLEEWTVGSRGFGAVLVFVLMAGEIYTTFTFLGGSGWAYGRGAPAFYILAYPTVAYLSSYFLLPAIWERGTRWRVLTQPEYFARAYDSPLLGHVVALVGSAALVAYLVLQLKGLGIIVAETSYGAIGASTAIVIGLTLVVLYVMLAGVRGSALTAALKDMLVLVSVIGLGIALPARLHGGIAPMLERLVTERPTFLTLGDTGLSRTWFASTTLLTALGFYLWPHTFGSLFTARDARVFRRNAMIMPLYQVVLLFVFFVGFAATLSMPGLSGTDADLALLRITRREYGPWIVGIVGAAGALTALVPASIILTTTATVLARLRQARAGDATQGMRTARLMVPVVAAIALAFTFRGGSTIVALLLMAYSLVTQLAPALFASLWFPGRISASGAIAGILLGECVVAFVTLTNVDLATFFPLWPRWITDTNIGFLALLVNTATMMLVSAGSAKSAHSARSLN
ncbi:MAG: sodium:solute symporter [Gemmatimonadaceae bacterium]|nr:sodium:solute symporter [Gemmatimonadaceae bacterium]